MYESEFEGIPYLLYSIIINGDFHCGRFLPWTHILYFWRRRYSAFPSCSLQLPTILFKRQRRPSREHTFLICFLYNIQHLRKPIHVRHPKIRRDSFIYLLFYTRQLRTTQPNSHLLRLEQQRPQEDGNRRLRYPTLLQHQPRDRPSHGHQLFHGANIRSLPMDTIPNLLELQRKIIDKGIHLRSYGNITILHIYREHMLHNSEQPTRLPTSLICNVSHILSQRATNQDKNIKTRPANSSSSCSRIPLRPWSHQGYSASIRKCSNL